MSDEAPQAQWSEQVAPPMAVRVGVMRADGKPAFVTLGLMTVHGPTAFMFDRDDVGQLIEQLTAARAQLPAIDVVAELPPELRSRLS